MCEVGRVTVLFMYLLVGWLVCSFKLLILHLVCICVNYTYAWCLRRSEEGAGSPEIGVVVAMGTMWVLGIEYSPCGKSDRHWESRQSASKLMLLTSNSLKCTLI